MRICLFFDAHQLDEFTLRNYKAYKNALLGICDVYFVGHLKQYKRVDVPESPVLLTDRDIFENIQQKKTQGYNLTPGNCDLKTLAAYHELPDYDIYLSVEYDVLCTALVELTFKKIINLIEGVDFAASYISPIAEANNDWVWWDSIKPPQGVSLPKASIRNAFLPLSAYSNKFLKIYQSAIIDGWVGHAEVLIPTIASINKLNVFDLALKPHQLTSFPQFTTHNPDALEEYIPPFIHPVKSMERYNGLPEYARRFELPQLKR